MCKHYDKLILRQKARTGFIDMDNNSEFGLIKKSITIITSLEELVQHSASYIVGTTVQANAVAEKTGQLMQEMRDKVEILERTNDQLVD